LIVAQQDGQRRLAVRGGVALEGRIAATPVDGTVARLGRDGFKAANGGQDGRV